MLGEWLVARQWEWVKKELADAESERAPSEAEARLEAMAPTVLAILESTLVVDAVLLRETIVRHLSGACSERRVSFVLAFLRVAGKRDTRERLALRPLRELCGESLAGWLRTPPRPPGDWSIATSLDCACGRCRTLNAFLMAPIRKTFEWPLAKDDRAHIHQIIEGYELPVGHQTRRTGRPYTLVLTKREDLFERDAKRRQRWVRDVKWLQRSKP